MRKLTLLVILLAVFGVGCDADRSEFAGVDEPSAEEDPGDASTPRGGGFTTEPPERTPAGTPPVSIEGEVNHRGTVDLTDQAGSPEITVEQVDFAFDPTFVRTVQDARVTVHIRNLADTRHTFTVPAFDVDEILGPGEERDVTFTLLKDDPVVYQCRFHESMGMQGAFFFES